jgi:hypothetical protein
MSIYIDQTAISYGSSTTLTVDGLNNVSITPSNFVVNTEVTLTGIIATLVPTISTIFYIEGYNNLNQVEKYNETVYVKVTAVNNYITVSYNTPIELIVNGCSSYEWYPSLYLNQNYGSNVVCTPLENITYTILGKDPFNTITRTYIFVTVNSNLIFTPENPTVYDGNILDLSVYYNLNSEQTLYTWKSEFFLRLPPNCVNLLYGDTIKLHPYNTIEYKVNAYQNNQLVTSGNIKVNVISKPSNIIDNDILPYQLYEYIINRNRKKLKEELLKNTQLSKKIIKFYYTTLQTAYRMEFTNKNGIEFKVPWLTYYQITNESNAMILSFEQQWKFFQYINFYQRKNDNITLSNFTFLLNNVNALFLEKPQKIYITPL